MTTPDEPAPPTGPDSVHHHNAAVWDRAAVRRDVWSTPVGGDEIAAARAGRWSVKLTPSRPVPDDWWPPLVDLEVLGLASGGGQQGPILAAAGARVTVVDLSAGQLELDREVAAEHGLTVRTVQSDAADLSVFADESFDLVFHPSSNSYMRDVEAVWAEAHRVLRPGGTLLAGFNNPVIYVFDLDDLDRGVLTVRHRLPYADERDLSPETVAALRDAGRALEYGHTLEQQIGGQLAAGFELVGLYEDRFDRLPLAAYMSTSIATRARKPSS